MMSTTKQTNKTILKEDKPFSLNLILLILSFSILVSIESFHKHKTINR
jgi:hypothetical protein